MRESLEKYKPLYGIAPNGSASALRNPGPNVYRRTR